MDDDQQNQINDNMIVFTNASKRVRRTLSVS